jgi:hypothetical protein
MNGVAEIAEKPVKPLHGGFGRNAGHFRRVGIRAERFDEMSILPLLPFGTEVLVDCGTASGRR